MEGISSEVVNKMRILDINAKIYGLDNFGSALDCYLRVFELWKYLCNSSTLREKGLEFTTPPSGYNFTIRFPENCRVYTLSISVLPDAMGNRGDSLSGKPETFETLLFDSNKNIVYHEDLGYDMYNNCEFHSESEVEKEILLLLEAAF